MDGGLWKGTGLCPEEPTGLGSGQSRPLYYINNKERALQMYRAACHAQLWPHGGERGQAVLVPPSRWRGPAGDGARG